MSAGRLRVLVVDDSAVVREVFSQIIAADPELELFATAADPIFAMEKTRLDWPDVIVLDIDMPRMDGITYLRKLAHERPTPVVICSSRAEKDAAVTFEALALGAAEIITKPKLGLKDFLTESSIVIADAIKAAARASSARGRHGTALAGDQPSAAVQQALGGGSSSVGAPSLSHADFARARAGTAVSAPALGRQVQSVIAIGASTGGTQAIEEILRGMPVDAPAILIVQHMPEKFTAAFARRLNQIVPLEVREAVDQDQVQQGVALVAAGNLHMRLAASGMRVDIFEGPLVNRHRPAVDVLFESVARLGARAGGVLLTGMGDDGALGMLEMRRRGSFTIAQDRETSVVYGMPAEAARLGAAVKVLPLSDIAPALLERVRRE